MAKAGAAVGRQTARWYRSIDPDLKRHLVQTPLLSYSLFSSRKVTVRAQEADGHPPLIFVHGLGGSRGDFLLMSSYFWLKGRSRTYRIHFRKGQSIDQMAKALAGFVRRVKRTTREKKVDIVAHSLGGLISRIAVVEHRLAGSVKTLITLGAPHLGTHSARLLDTETFRDLRPESVLMRRLRNKRWPSRVRGVTFWSRSDLMILPPESAALPGTSTVEMPRFTHYSYLIDPKSWRTVYETLDQGAPEAPPTTRKRLREEWPRARRTGD